MSIPASNSSQSSRAIFILCGIVTTAIGIGLVLAAQSDRRMTSLHPAPAVQQVKVPARVPDSVSPLDASTVPGLENVYRLGDEILTGSVPEDEAAFAALASLGIKTVVSVDATTPDIDAAHAYGMRYLHLPISYSKIPQDRLLQLVQAQQTSCGPIYIHCRHGKNRGPAAAVALWRCIDQSVTVDQAVVTLQRIGTADRYQGLYESIRILKIPTSQQLQSNSIDLPEVSNASGLAKSMALIDRMWDEVTDSKQDRNSITICNQMNTVYDIAEQFRESTCLSEITDEMCAEIPPLVSDMENLAELIKVELRNPNQPPTAREAVVAQIKNRCVECHARFRD